jgi:adenosine deaminase
VIKAMMDLGLRVTVNSDDPAYFGGYIEENFALVQDKLDLGPQGLATISCNAFEAAWLPRRVKDGYLAQVQAHLEAAG